MNCMAEDNFHTQDIEDLRLHYNRTLLCWEKNFKEHIDEARTMFDERFLRMWDMYLSACAATFHNGIIDIHQILMTKGINNDLPMTRWYLKNPPGMYVIPGGFFVIPLYILLLSSEPSLFQVCSLCCHYRRCIPSVYDYQCGI